MTTESLCFPTRASGSLSGLFSAIATRVAKWREASATRVALNKLSDRELDDIGLTRGDINIVAAQYRA